MPYIYNGLLHSLFFKKYRVKYFFLKKSIPEEPELTLDDDQDDDDNIVPSDRLAAQSSAQLEDELAKFRYEWKMELLLDQKDPSSQSIDSSVKSSKQSQRKNNRMEHHAFPSRASKPGSSVVDEAANTNEQELNYEQPKTNEEKAKYLFDKAVQLEQQGRHFDAIKFYRMAMQLDADIEFKLASSKPVTRSRTKKSDEFVKHESEDDDEEKADNDVKSDEIVQDESKSDELKTLYEKFTAITLEENKLCEKNFPQKVCYFFFFSHEVFTDFIDFEPKY